MKVQLEDGGAGGAGGPGAGGLGLSPQCDSWDTLLSTEVCQAMACGTRQWVPLFSMHAIERHGLFLLSYTRVFDRQGLFDDTNIAWGMAYTRSNAAHQRKLR